MKLFRNKEVQRTLLLFLALTAVLTGIGCFISQTAGGLMLAGGLLFTLLFAVSTALRYRQIAKLSAELDEILHGNTSIRLSNYNEGELSLLENQITKMLNRLREQSEQLMLEKKRLNDLIADISHQIRTPLTSIHLLTASLGRGEQSPDEQFETLRELNMQLSKIEWLISSLLKLARLDANTTVFRSDPISFDELIGKVMTSLSVLMDIKGQTLEKDLSGGFVGDLRWTEEAVSNIFKNCIEHMSEGGRLRVIARENPLYSELIISDNGCGIDKNDLPHLFDRFYKGKSASEQSVGIGLALARMIITRQNGTISAENNPEGGARFIIRFYKQII